MAVTVGVPSPASANQGVHVDVPGVSTPNPSAMRLHWGSPISGLQENIVGMPVQLLAMPAQLSSPPWLHDDLGRLLQVGGLNHLL